MLGEPGGFAECLRRVPVLRATAVIPALGLQRIDAVHAAHQIHEAAAHRLTHILLFVFHIQGNHGFARHEEVEQEQFEQIALTLAGVAEDQDVGGGLIVIPLIKIYEDIGPVLVLADVESVRIGLALAFNAGTSGGYTIAYVCAIIGGIANSFLDTGIYPAVAEIIYKAPGVATMGIKFFIAIAQMLLPFVLGATVATTAAGLTSYNHLFFGCGIIYLVLFVMVFLFPLPDADQKAAGKKEGLIDSLKHTHFSFESIAMILIGFTCTGTFQLWLNCAQNFAKENVGWTDPSIMQTYYSAGTLIALVVTALLTRKIKDVRFIVIYPVICLATLIVVLTGQNQTLMIAGAFIIGWAGAGGLLQIATSVCNMLFPKIKGTVTALVMIASSLCNYTILTAASKMQPSQVMIMNIVLTAVGVVLGLFVNIRYKKMVELAEAEN